jgi:hypothetical protein
MRYVAPGALQCRVEEIDGVRVHRKLLLSARGTKSATAPRMRRLLERAEEPDAPHAKNKAAVTIIR